MHQFLDRSWPSALISGLLTYVAICHINFMCSWICYVPLFISIYNTRPVVAFKGGFIFGSAFSILAFSWMIPGAERFTGYNILYGVGVFFLSTVFFSLYAACVLYSFALLKRTGDAPNLVLVNGVLAAAVFCVAEALLMVLSSGFPWFDVHSGNGLARNKYAIQPAAFFGIHIMTFVAVMVNYLFAIFIAEKLWCRLYIPVCIIIAWLLSGYFIFQNFETRLPANKRFKVAISFLDSTALNLA